MYIPKDSSFTENNTNDCIIYDRDYSDTIDRLALASVNSHYKYLFDYDTVKISNRSEYVLHLFMPTYALKLGEIIQDRDNRTQETHLKQKSKTQKKQVETSCRIRKINHEGIPLPKWTKKQFKDDPDIGASNDSVNDKNSYTEAQIQKLFRDIKQTLYAIESDYYFMLEKNGRRSVLQRSC